MRSAIGQSVRAAAFPNRISATAGSSCANSDSNASSSRAGSDSSQVSAKPPSSRSISRVPRRQLRTRILRRRASRSIPADASRTRASPEQTLPQPGGRFHALHVFRTFVTFGWVWDWVDSRRLLRGGGGRCGDFRGTAWARGRQERGGADHGCGGVRRCGRRASAVVVPGRRTIAARGCQLPPSAACAAARRLVGLVAVPPPRTRRRAPFVTPSPGLSLRLPDGAGPRV